jgi:cupin fold WbuC family metalloprotein
MKRHKGNVKVDKFDIMELIDKSLLDKVSIEAQQNPRLRMNYNFHTSMDAKSQRLLNALQPGTVLAVHRHPHTAETYVLLRGRLKVLFYNDRGEITETAVLDPLKGMYGINIPAGQWHTVEVLEPDTVIYETKDGPYMPLGNENILNIL